MSGLPQETHAGPARVVTGLLLGAPFTVYGLWWLLHNSRLTDPPGLATVLVAFVLAHDLLLVPIGLVVAVVVGRFVPRWAAAPALVALALSVVLTFVAYPALTRNGVRPSNPTLLPRDTLAGLLVSVAVVWVGAAGWALWRRSRSVAGG